MKKHDSESSLLITNRLLQTTIDTSSIIDLPSMIDFKSDRSPIIYRASQQILINDALDDQLEISNSKFHVEKVKLQIDEVRRHAKQNRFQMMDYRQDRNTIEHQSHKDIGKQLFEFSASFEELKKKYSQLFQKQLNENQDLRQQISREQNQLQEVRLDIIDEIVRLDAVQHQLGRYIVQQEQLQ